MASISPSSVLEPADRNTSFSRSISVTSGDPIVSITVTNDFGTTGLTINVLGSTISISGTFADVFIDEFTYVDRGSSDLLETPKTTIGVFRLPPNKDFFNLDQDLRDDINITWTITVVTTTSTETFTLTQLLRNNWQFLANFIEQYYD